MKGIFRLVTHFMVEDYHGEPEEIRGVATGGRVHNPFYAGAYDCEHWASEIAQGLHSEMDYPEECEISFYANGELVCTVNVEARMEPVFYATEVTE